MKKSLSSIERELQIELMRSRAALERQNLRRNLNGLGQSLQPAAVVRSLFPRMAAKKPSDWLFQALALTRQYPLLASTASALFTGVGKRRRLWRIGAGLLLSWQVARAMKNRD